MVTIRHLLLTKLQERLSQFNFSTWSPEEVHIGRTMFDPDVDRLPLLTVVAGTDTSNRSAYRTNQREMQVDVSGIVSLDDGADVTELCEPIYGEIEKACFHGGEIQIGDNYYSIEFRGGGIVDYPSDPGPALVTVGVSLAVTYETDIGDPTS